MDGCEHVRYDAAMYPHHSDMQTPPRSAMSGNDAALTALPRRFWAQPGAVAPAPRPERQVTDPPAAPDDLPGLRADFPTFRIWREDICGRTRYIAYRQHPDQHPHTVITDDPAELRAALKPAPGP
jgi:hypothetical protein